MDLERLRRILQLLLDQNWQPQKVHDLGDTGPRKAFTHSDAGLCQCRVRRDFLSSASRQLKRTDLGTQHFRFLIVLDSLPGIQWKHGRVNEKRRRSPARKRDSEGQSEIPPGSEFARVSGAIKETQAFSGLLQGGKGRLMVIVSGNVSKNLLIALLGNIFHLPFLTVRCLTGELTANFVCDPSPGNFLDLCGLQGGCVDAHIAHTSD